LNHTCNDKSAHQQQLLYIDWLGQVMIEPGFERHAAIREGDESIQATVSQTVRGMMYGLLGTALVQALALLAVGHSLMREWTGTADPIVRHDEEQSA